MNWTAPSNWKEKKTTYDEEEEANKWWRGRCLKGHDVIGRSLEGRCSRVKSKGFEGVGVEDVPRMEKSPLLANGYNHPPTHLSHMQFMQLGGHPGAGHTAILSPASLPHHLQAQAQARAEQGLKVNPNMSNMEALA
ncbi:hypothetical protein K0M31_018050, partial [Melipona bicolor]